jgi:putative SOS response-associated peptidase YedK
LSRIADYFQAVVHEGTLFADSWNIAPSTMVPVVRINRAGERVLINHRWGLIPHWAGEEATSLNLYNARGETVADKPAFRTSFKRMRCLVPASGYYEWQAPPAGSNARKQPYYLSPLASHAAEHPPILKNSATQPTPEREDANYFAMAGVCDHWKAANGELVMSFAIITTQACESIAHIHHRMPVMLDRKAWTLWLDPENHAIETLTPLLHASDQVQAWPVSLAVSSAGKNRRDAADLIEAI